MPVVEVDGIMFSQMVNAGAARLKAHVTEVNDLNVFPIPDGDTGDNMFLTMMGGVHTEGQTPTLCDMAERVSGGMLLSARGNSGVILSQFFEGISQGLDGLQIAHVGDLERAFSQGVTQAYHAVMTPTEGTILTVAREATAYACEQKNQTAEAFLDAFVDRAKESLAHTPELLPVLKKAGVVDSGGAGLVYIAEGMKSALTGEMAENLSDFAPTTNTLDLDAFGEDDVLTFGYCTELLVRLQNAKVDVETFDVSDIVSYLQTIGDSVVAVKNGSIVKLHVHTMTPHKVLAFCQQFGEFLKVKIENMSLQHNNTVAPEENTPRQERKAYGVVVVASGEGLKQTFLDMGAHVVVDGGQSMNPSTEDFLSAFDAVNAETVLVFPNNSNILLTAKQAADLYGKADVRVIPSTTIGAGYASLSMLDTGAGDTETIVELLCDAMQGVVTAEVSHCVRDACLDGEEIHTGDYIGFVGKEILASGKDRLATLKTTVDKMGLSSYDICILICGRDVMPQETQAFQAYMTSHYPQKEVYIIEGGQDVYDYIIVAE